MLIRVRTADGAPGTWFAVRARAGQTWAQAVYLSGIFEPPALCAGQGRCGNCRLRLLGGDLGPAAAPFKREVSILGLESVAQGWRLGCLRPAADGLYLELPPGTRLLPGAAPPSNQPAETPPDPPAAPESEISLALDFGTTSLAWAVAEPSGEAPAPALPAKVVNPAGQMINPQMGGGSDVISRLALTTGPTGNLAGRRGLQSLSLKALSRILRDFSRQAVKEVVLAANPAMTYLLLGLDAAGLAAAPYHLEYLGGETVRLPALPGFSGPGSMVPPLWICPLVSPFIGGDVSAGYAWLRYGQEAEFPFVLADMGTNGEFVLALDETRALAASVPLGPALEGMGMNCGALAGPGVITGFELTAEGLIPKIGPGGSGAPVGISGTGYLSLLQHMRQLGLMDEAGHPVRFDAEDVPADSRPLTPLYRRLAGAFGTTPEGDETAWYIDGNLYLSAGDVEEILKVKAAFRLALRLLLREAGLRAADLKQLYIAGALGSHVSPESFTGLGFAPAAMAGRTRAAGNTSLAGAALLAGRRRLRENLLAWCGGVTTLNLAESTEFQDLFAGEMHFRTD